jgi:hypothetical protein
MSDSTFLRLANLDDGATFALKTHDEIGAVLRRIRQLNLLPRNEENILIASYSQPRPPWAIVMAATLLADATVAGDEAIAAGCAALWLDQWCRAAEGDGPQPPPPDGVLTQIYAEYSAADRATWKSFWTEWHAKRIRALRRAMHIA